jgi:hypothetical protein
MNAARLMPARFAGTCTDCGKPIARGAMIQWQKGRGAQHAACFAENDRGQAWERHSDDPEVELARRERRHDESEYAKGIADGRQYHEDMQMFGAEMGERIAMDRELAAYNRGEDY